MRSKTKPAFTEARHRLADAMRRGDLTQAALADMLDITQSAFSQRLGRDSVSIFVDLAEVFPTACKILADLYGDLSKIYETAFLEIVDKNRRGLATGQATLRELNNAAKKKGK